MLVMQAGSILQYLFDKTIEAHESCAPIGSSTYHKINRGLTKRTLTLALVSNFFRAVQCSEDANQETTKQEIGTSCS